MAHEKSREVKETRREMASVDAGILLFYTALGELNISPVTFNPALPFA